MTAINHSTYSRPLTSKQFLSFETIAGGLFALFVAIGVYAWNGHLDDFKLLRSDVKTIGVVIPTLATKAEMNAKFDKIDEKFDKMDDKLDALILSVNTMQNTMATKEDLAACRRWL